MMVADTGPLIAFARIRHLGLLQAKLLIAAVQTAAMAWTQKHSPLFFKSEDKGMLTWRTLHLPGSNDLYICARLSYHLAAVRSLS